MVIKKGTEQYIFSDPKNISNILVEMGIPLEDPHHNFYINYIADKLKGTWFVSLEEMRNAVLPFIPKTASLSLRKKAIRFPKPQVSKQELKRLYTQEVGGLYDKELMDEVISKFLIVLEGMIEYVEKEWEMSGDLAYQVDEQIRPMILDLEEALTLPPEQKMIVIDQVINLAHQSGVYGQFLVKDICFNDPFFDELSNLKVSSLNLSKKSEYRTDQENFYGPGKSDEWPKGPKKPKLRLPFHNAPDEQGNMINSNPNYSNPMEYDSSPGTPAYGPGICGSLSMRSSKFAYWDEIDNLVEQIFAKNHHMTLGSNPTEDEFDNYLSEHLPDLDPILKRELYDRYLMTYEEVHSELSKESAKLTPKQIVEVNKIKSELEVVPAQKIINLYDSEVKGLIDGALLDDVAIQLCVIARRILKISDRMLISTKDIPAYMIEAITDEFGHYKYTEQFEMLWNKISAIEHAQTSTEKMLAVDNLLNTIHGIGSMVPWFIEGGTSTLDKVRDQRPKPKKEYLPEIVEDLDIVNERLKKELVSNNESLNLRKYTKKLTPKQREEFNRIKENLKLVSAEKIFRLYESERKGLLDETLLDDVATQLIVIGRTLSEINTIGGDRLPKYLDEVIVDEYGNYKFTEEMTQIDGVVEMLEVADTPEEKMIAVDQTLHLTHFRGHLASWFVEGGINTLDAVDSIKEKGVDVVAKIESLNMKLSKINDEEVVDIKQEDVDLAERFHARNANKMKLGLPLDDYSAEFIIREEFKNNKEELESFVEELKSEYPAIREVYQIRGANDWLIIDCGYSPFEALEKATQKDNPELYQKYIDKLKEIAEIIRKTYETVV